MIPKSHTLTLTIILSFLSAAADAPAPSPSPAKTLLSEPIGILRHPPPVSDTFRRLHPPPPPSCPSGRIDCLETRRRGGGSQPAKIELEKLNFGKKMGIVFAAAAVLLQLVLGSFLVYKRVQLKKMDQRGDRLVDSS